MNRFKLSSSLLVIGLLGAVGAAAQDDQAPPSLVGRLAGVNGQVSLHRADQQDWTDAGINEPITVGDAVYAAQGGMARLEIGGTDLALLGDSEIDIAALDENTSRLRLDTGGLDLRVTVLPAKDGLYVMTPRGVVRLTQPGTYRIETGDENSPTRVTAWDGVAEFGEGGATAQVHPGQVLLVSGTADMPQYAYAGGPGEPPREFRGRSRVVAQNYVAPDMTGAEDLPQYGDWQQTPDYGPVWYPNNVQADWEPYRYGHWESVAPWGWTWIDDQPWGFAPFHYGRWANINGRWGWCPGRYEPHPVYAPALVAFFGGAGISLSLGHGPDVGWVPLAPGEFYRPPYRGGERYIENLNRAVGRGEGGREHFDRGGSAEAFANRRFATVVPQDVLRGARPVGRSVVSVPAGALLGHAQVGAEALRGVAPAEHARPSGRPGPVVPPSNPAQAAAMRPAFTPRPGAPGFVPHDARAAAPQSGADGVTQRRPPAPAFVRPGVPQAPQPTRGEPDRGFREGRPGPAQPTVVRPEVPQAPQPQRAEPDRGQREGRPPLAAPAGIPRPAAPEVHAPPQAPQPQFHPQRPPPQQQALPQRPPQPAAVARPAPPAAPAPAPQRARPPAPGDKPKAE